MKKHLDHDRFMYVVMVAILIVTLTVMVGFNLFLDHETGDSTEFSDHAVQYTYHVAMISMDSSDVFWKSLYKGAEKEGVKHNIYPENFGANLNEDYSVEELMQMAVASKVDGIVIETDETEEMHELIEAASGAHIPVVTLMKDDPESQRISYVGANTYTLGEIYGEEVADAVEKDTAKAVILVPENEKETSPNYIYSGISETITGTSRNIEVSTVRTGKDKEFVSEETIRNLLLDEEKRPDVLVCLSATDTISAYQCVRDYNLVGQVKIIGYYISSEILEGIQNGVIESTVLVDAEEAGILCMEAMSEYLSQHYTNEYFPVPVELITQENVASYMKQEGGE